MRNIRNLIITRLPDLGEALVAGTCLVCKQPQEFYVSLTAWNRFEMGMGPIQDLFPSLDSNQREFLISRVCGPCFDSITKEPNE